MRTEQRQEFLRDVQIREGDAAAVWRLLVRHGAEDLADVLGIKEGAPA